MNCYYIIGLRVDHRRSNALNLQKALTEFGCNIRLRVGLHETSEEFCSDDGVIMLQACGVINDHERSCPRFQEVMRGHPVTFLKE